LTDLYQYERYYADDSMDTVLNQFHRFDFLKLIVDNEQHISLDENYVD